LPLAFCRGEQNAALSPQIASVEAPPIVGSYSVPDMFWATNQMVQKMLYSKGEIAKDGQDGSLTSRWNFAQRPHSNSPVVSRVQGSDAYSSTKTEVITFCSIINTDFTTLGHHNHLFSMSY
jgi:hypothetical protein